MKKTMPALLFLLMILPAFAAMPNEQLSDPAQEARALALTMELRCMVCQNQSIEESDAPLAHDLRRLVREQVTSGKSDEDIRAYLVARYGEFVLLRPVLRPETYLLWFAPLLALLAGFGIAAVKLFRKES
jgi:cytochrome c-type biogenesis protein CcmH